MNRSELRALAEAATRDEWVTLPTLDGSLAVSIVVGDLATEIPVPVTDADALFIAAACNALPALLDRLEAAEALLREADVAEAHAQRGIYDECDECGNPWPCWEERRRAFLEDTQ